MSLTDDVVSQVSYMAQELSEEHEALVEVISQAVTASLAARLRSDLDPEDCRTEFVTAAGMYAVAALTEIGDWSQVEQLTAGDLTLRSSGSNKAADYLRSQADMLMAPYLKVPFAFMGV